MNKCLNCGKECINKYCSVTCQNIYKGILNKENYKLNPSYCNSCGCELKYELRKNKFCSHSCSASINNKGVSRNKNGKYSSNEGKTDYIYNSVSNEIFIELIKNSANWRDLSLKLGYNSSIASKTRKKIIEKANILGFNIDFYKELIKYKSKKEIFELSKNWQSARTTIRKNACDVFSKSGKEYKCIVCGYEKHVDIAHIKSVSDFDDTCLMIEINDINNLVALCPNHHWEYDHSSLDIKK